MPQRSDHVWRVGSPINLKDDRESTEFADMDIDADDDFGDDVVLYPSANVGSVDSSFMDIDAADEALYLVSRRRVPTMSYVGLVVWETQMFLVYNSKPTKACRMHILV